MRVAVDLTPLLPGGENGGAKPMVLSLLQHLLVVRPEWSLVLLTNASTHEELSILDGPQVERRCVVGEQASGVSPAPSWPYRVLRQGYQWARRIVPEKILLRWKRWYYHWRWTPGPRWFTRGLLEEISADLLFAPFTAPFFHDPRVPLVSVIYDLQFMEYPHFFSPEERAHRHQYLTDAVRLSTHLITISEFVRHTVLMRFPLSPERVTAIPIGLPRLLPQLPDSEAQTWLQKQGLRPGGYLLYPANFWPHKNHEMLLLAFRLLREDFPDMKVHLVLTGALAHRRRFLMEAAQEMGLEQWVRFPGFLPEAHLGTLYAHALGLIFPSLYEGFGIPLLEAMSMGVPVACSGVASLPEVAGEAALFFDPRNPEQIAEAMRRLIQDETLREDLIRRGREQVRHFGDAKELAQRYAELFEQVVNQQAHIVQYALERVTPDGWLEPQTFFAFPQSAMQRVLELTCELPSWIPFPMTLHVQTKDGRVLVKHRLRPGERASWQIPLPHYAGYWRLLIYPPYRPQDWGSSHDARVLGMRCLKACVREIGQAKEYVLWPRKQMKR